MSLRELLIADEGLRLKPYRCTEGKLTIGADYAIICGPKERANALPALTLTTYAEAAMADHSIIMPEWRPVPGFPGYLVSDDGRVKSVARYTKRHDYPVFVGERELSLRVRYRRGNRPVCVLVTLCKDGVPSDHRVHRLVLGAFVGPCPDGMEGCHSNGDPTDNRLANLRWDTREENLRDMDRHGTRTTPPRHVGETHPRAKMTVEIARKILAVKHWPNGTATRLARELGISAAMVRHTRDGRCWRHANDSP